LKDKQKYINLVPSKIHKNLLYLTSRTYPTKTYLKTLSALAKGPNFAVARKIPKEEIISQIESTIYQLPSEQADNIRK